MLYIMVSIAAKDKKLIYTLPSGSHLPITPLAPTSLSLSLSIISPTNKPWL